MNSSKEKLIKQLAEEFTGKLTELPVNVLPNNDIVYEDYLIKNHNGHWELYSITNKDKIATFFLRSCALIAAKCYKSYLFNEYREIKQLDRDYKRNYLNSVIYRHSLKASDDFDTKVIILNQLECSESDAEYYKKKISRLFKTSFV